MFVLEVPSEHYRFKLGDQELVLSPKSFKSGSKGWFLGGKIMLGGHKVQLSFSAVIVGSKPPAELIEVNNEEELKIEVKTPKKGSKKPPRDLEGQTLLGG